MSKNINTPLRFYIQLTQIIGRTFTDLQQLLKSQLKYQQEAANNQILSQSINNNSVEANRSESQIKNFAISESKSQSRQQKLNQQRGKLQMKHRNGEEKQRKQQSKAKKKKLIRKDKQKQLKPKKLKSNKWSERKGEKKKMKSKKQAISEGKPYPPLNAFMLFLKQNKYEIMKKRPDLSPSEVSIHASTIWNNFSDQEKQHYVKIYRKNHEIYLQQLKIFNMKKKGNKKERKERSTEKEKDIENSEQKEREQKNNDKNDSPFEMNDDKQKEVVGNRLRQNLRSRKRKQPHQIICLESSVSQSQKSKCSQQI